MNRLAFKISAFVSTFLFSMLLMAAAASANTDGGPTISCVISGNGSDSWNWCKIKKKSVTIIYQSNWAKVTNSVFAVASSGGNSANDNTGGSVSVDSGNASVTVTITNTLNQNNQ